MSSRDQLDLARRLYVHLATQKPRELLDHARSINRNVKSCEETLERCKKIANEIFDAVMNGEMQPD